MDIILWEKIVFYIDNSCFEKDQFFNYSHLNRKKIVSLDLVKIETFKRGSRRYLRID